MSFATVDDVAARVGRDLTGQEQTQAEFLLDAAAVVLADAAGKPGAWIETVDPIPQMLTYLSVELVVRVLSNPDAASSVTERLGQYSTTRSWATNAGAAGMTLSSIEQRLARRAVYGTGAGAGSARLDSIATELYDCGDGS